VSSASDLRAEIRSQDLWYHTIELAPGVLTPGWFDLRPIVDRLPWPDLRGKRCLDVATYDGFLAFEMERRGAAEVVATDIPDHEDWDWLPRERAGGLAFLEHEAGTKGKGFEIAAAALGSSVKRRILSVYDLHPDVVGEFDVVVCGSLMLHLRDPFRALEAIRGVCRGEFMSAEQIEVGSSALRSRTPVFRLRARDGQWLVPNVAGHRRMLEIAGFDILETAKPYAIPSGVAHPSPPRSLGHIARVLALRGVVGGVGVPMSAVRCRPAAL
jgi:tRNA (mo5U34)-methyltransferase